MIINCLTKPPEGYIVELPEGLAGLWISYGYDPYLFSLLSRTSSAFFMYEPGFESIPPNMRTANLEKIELWVQTLDAKIGDKSVRKCLETMPPREFTDLVFESEPEHLPLCDLFKVLPPGGTKSKALWFNMYLRALQHEKYYRGKLAGEKITSAAFRSRISADEDVLLENQKVNLLRDIEALLNDKRISQ